MNITKLQDFENDTQITDRYLGSSAFGEIKIIYLPLITGIFLLLFVGYAPFSNFTKVIGYPAIIGLAIVALVCFYIVSLIYKKSKANLKAKLDKATTCIGKLVLGNDTAMAYYCIYTTSDERYNTDFLEKMTRKILACVQNPINDMEKQIAKRFGPKDINNHQGVLLPLEFTEQIPVYQKQIMLSGSSPAMVKAIKDDSNLCALITLVPSKAMLLREYYN